MDFPRTPDNANCLLRCTCSTANKKKKLFELAEILNFFGNFFYDAKTFPQTKNNEHLLFLREFRCDSLLIGASVMSSRLRMKRMMSLLSFFTGAMRTLQRNLVPGTGERRSLNDGDTMISKQQRRTYDLYVTETISKQQR